MASLGYLVTTIYVLWTPASSNENFILDHLLGRECEAPCLGTHLLFISVNNNTSLSSHKLYLDVYVRKGTVIQNGIFYMILFS